MYTGRKRVGTVRYEGRVTLETTRGLHGTRYSEVYSTGGGDRKKGGVGNGKPVRLRVNRKL